MKPDRDSDHDNVCKQASVCAYTAPMDLMFLVHSHVDSVCLTLELSGMRQHVRLDELLGVTS